MEVFLQEERPVFHLIGTIAKSPFLFLMKLPTASIQAYTFCPKMREKNAGLASGEGSVEQADAEIQIGGEEQPEQIRQQQIRRPLDDVAEQHGAQQHDKYRAYAVDASVQRMPDSHHFISPR